MNEPMKEGEMPHQRWLRADPIHTASVAERGTGTFLVGTFSSDVGSRPYKLYIPPGYSPDTPASLLVALHGCTQDPDNFAVGTRFNTLADRDTFLVLYPQQTRAHQPRKCWAWYDPANQERGSGEPAIIAGMVDDICTRYAIDTNRIFVTGMSAGAAMAVILGACYPDYFAAIGVHSGLEFKAARDLVSAAVAQVRGGPDPDLQGRLAHLSAGSAARVLPVIVFHGSNDYRVYPVNGDQVIQQFARTNDYADDGSANNSISPIPDRIQTGLVPDGYSYTISIYTFKNQVLMQMYSVEGLGHAWSGGSLTPPATYTDPKGPDASSIMWEFFTAHPRVIRSSPSSHLAYSGEVARKKLPSLRTLLAHWRKKRVI